MTERTNKATVTQFPDHLARGWRRYSEGMRAGLASIGAGPHEIATVLASIEPAWRRVAWGDSVPIEPGNPEAAVRTVNEWIATQIEGLLVELALRELQLVRLKNE